MAREEFFDLDAIVLLSELILRFSLESDTKALKIETLVCTKSSSQFSMLQ